MSESWYVLRSKPRREEALWQQVLHRGFEVFYPCIPVQPVNPRARTTAPYFPGYMFVRFNLDAVGLFLFQWMPYSSGLICFDNIPTDVPDTLIELIKTRVASIVAVGSEVPYELKRGEQVIIQSGPFVGYEALFDMRLHGSDRVRVLLNMLNQRQVPIELQVEQVVRKRSLRNE